jgi:hypothetical protein
MKGQRSTIKVTLRFQPWPAFALRKYAETFSKTLADAATDGIKCLLYDGVEKKTKQEWLREYHKQGRGSADDEVD